MIEEQLQTHPWVVASPHARLWRRSERRAQAFRPATHAELVVLQGLSGQGRYVIGGRAVTLRAGSLLLAWAGIPHFLAQDTPDFDMWVGLVSRRFTKDAPMLPPVDGGGASAEARALPKDLSDRLTSLAESVRLCPLDQGQEQGLHWWLNRVWQAWRDAPKADGQTIHPAVIRAARLLRDDPRLSVADLATRSGLSPGRLGQRFRSEMGQSLVQFRTKERLARVRASVETRNTPLLTAALDAGFGSYAQFWRAWTAETGESPRSLKLRQTETGAPKRTRPPSGQP